MGWRSPSPKATATELFNAAITQIRWAIEAFDRTPPNTR
jgi:hypothetical protein